MNMLDIVVLFSNIRCRSITYVPVVQVKRCFTHANIVDWLIGWKKKTNLNRKRLEMYSDCENFINLPSIYSLKLVFLTSLCPTCSFIKINTVDDVNRMKRKDERFSMRVAPIVIMNVNLFNATCVLRGE